MSEMIDRAAQALADLPCIFERWNDWTSNHVPGLPVEICTEDVAGGLIVIARYPGQREGDGFEHLARHKNEARVRAVLTAIREPSEGMVRAGDDAITYHPEDIICNQSEPCWQAMIDAALAE